MDFEQQHKKNGGDLGESVGLAENAGTEIAQSGDGIEHGAGKRMEMSRLNTSTVNFQGILCRIDKHHKHGAEQKFVGDGIEILAEYRLLLESAGEQAVEAVADPGQHK